MSKRGIVGLLTVLSLTAQLVSGQLQPDCNPLQAECQPKNALARNSYYIDFTKQTGAPSDWVIANNEAVKFTSNGAEFSYAKKGDAPNMWTDFYMLGGRYDVEMKIAPGQGVISSAVLWSDTQDEIDYEFSGNQFGQTPFPPKDGMWSVETNVFAQGKMWDGAAAYQKDAYKPAEQFHKYSVEWDEDHMSWYVDDKVVRTVQAKSTPSGFTFPQSPMKLQLGVWGGGDSDNSYWTKQWAGGEIDMKGAPYTMYVKSVSITNKYPACQYRFKDKTGKIGSIEKVQDGCERSAHSGSPMKVAKAEAAGESYPMSSPDSAVSTAEPSTGYPTSYGYPTYEASSSSAVHSSSSSHAQSYETYPASSPSSSHSSASSPAQYETYPASSPSSSHSSASSAASSSSSHSSASSSVEPIETYPASPPASSHSSTSSSPATYPAASVSSAAGSSSSGYPISSPSSSSGILSSLSSFFLGTSSTASAQSGSTLTNSLSTSTASSSASSSKGSSSGYPVSSASSASSAQSASSSSASGTTYSYSMSSGKPSSSAASVVGNTISTIYSTNVYTVTSCAPTVTNCPVGKVTTESISVSETMYPVSGPSETKPSSSSSKTQSSLSSSLSSSSSVLSSTVKTESSSQSSSASASTYSSKTMPSTYSVSSEIVTSVLSTVYTTNVVTVTSCPASVTNCPTGHVTVITETKSAYTTVCPVTQTILDGTTYGGTEPVKSTPSSSPPATYPASSPSASAGSASSSSSSAHASSSSTGSVGTSSSVHSSSSAYVASSSVSSAAQSSSNSSPVISSSISVGTSSSILSSSIVFQNSTVSVPGSHFTESLATYPASSAPASSSVTKMTTSTVYSTNIYTITSCAPTVTNCPGKIGQVTTELVSLYTTVCPVTESETVTKGSSSSVLPVATETSTPAQTISSYATVKNSTVSSPVMTTSTVYTSSIYTVSTCKPGEADCSSKIGSVTTEIVPLYTTVCPVTETASVLPTAVTGSTVSGSSVKSSASQVGSSTVKSGSSSRVESSSSEDVPSYTASQESYTASSASYKTSAPSYTTSTVYSTRVYTVTSCSPGVTNCPAKGSVVTETVAVSTTVCPVADATVPAASQYTTTAFTLSNTVSGSVIVITSTISFIDTPAPTTVEPVETVSGASSSPKLTKPGTTITLGTYFTTTIEYDTITRGTPASVSSGALPTSYYTAPPPAGDVPSYSMSQGSSTVALPPTLAPVPVSPASSSPLVSFKTVPDDDTTTLTSPVVNTHTATQPHPKQSSTCPCGPGTVYVTVTQTVAQVTVTSTVQPPYPSSYAAGSAPAGTGGYVTSATSTPAAARRWFRRGHGNGGGHGH